jgi:hypothetical protein
MNYREIDLSDLGAVLRPGVWLTRGQLADLFGVYYGTITANIKAIIRSGVVRPSPDGDVIVSGKTVLPERYAMEMVIALAFRLNSVEAERVRRYILQRIAARTGRPVPQIFLSYGVGVVN